MSSSSILREGDSLTICFGEKESYHTLVQELKEDGVITATAPLEVKSLIALKPKCPVRISYAKADARYEFDAVVQTRYRHKEVAFLDFLPLSEHKRIQRRENYRLKITLDAYVRVQASESTEDDEEWIKMYTVDLSGEGSQLKSFTPIPDHTLLECMICLDENKVIRTNGEVLEVFEIDGDRVPFRLRIHFYDINDDHRDRIIGFVFEEQLRRRKREPQMLAHE
jgi:c-di-GMP-binding flagellar brake protein YcgR